MTMIRSSKKHIDEEQPKDIEEHFKAIITDNCYLDTNYTKVSPNDLPDWFDEKLFKRGQQYYHDHVLGLNLAFLTSSLAIFLVPTFSEVALFTKQSSTPCAAFKRYFQTLIHIVNLYENDYNDANSKFYKSINTIRWKHAIMNKKFIGKNIGITHRDMVLTQFGFVGYNLIEPEIFGNSNDFEGRQGMLHYWRVVGHLIGIPDKLNVCRRNVDETILLCEKIREVFVKYLKQSSDEFLHLILNSAEGLRAVDPTIDTENVLLMMYKLHRLDYDKPLSLYSRLIYIFRMKIIHSISSPYTRWIARPFWNYSFKILIWFNEKYPIIAWFKYGKKQSKFRLYPNQNIL